MHTDWAGPWSVTAPVEVGRFDHVAEQMSTCRAMPCHTNKELMDQPCSQSQSAALNARPWPVVMGYDTSVNNADGHSM